MKIKYLGTGAAEAIPALFCHCPICENARKQKGKEIRSRTSVMIDEVMIDFSPDVFFNMIRYELAYADLEYLLVTHSHLDHFDAGELVMRNPTMYSHALKHHLLHIYGNKTVHTIFKRISALDNQGEPITGMQFNEIKYEQPFQCGSFTITALQANHKPDEEAMIFLLEKNGKCILYAHDTGELYPNVYAYLEKKAIQLDFVSLDCTCGTLDCENGHMGFNNVLKVQKRLKPFLKLNALIVISHFSHNGKATHTLLEQMCQNTGIIPTYDGIEFNI